MRPFSAGDAKSWAHCPRRAWFDYHPPEGLAMGEDPFESLVFDAGDAHERRILSMFPSYTEATSVGHTQELMRAGVPVIYQPHLVDEDLGIIGRPDFLLRANDGTYRAADAKLATRLAGHKDIAAQVSTYRQLIGTPHKALVFLGNGETAEVGDEYDDIRHRFQVEMRSLVDSDTMPPAHFGYSRCGACPYDALCRRGFEAAGDLGLSPAVDPRSIPGLAAQGFPSLSDLADAEVEAIDDVPYLKGDAKKRRAILQAKSLLTGQVYVEGQPRLPANPRIHLDLESDPLARNGEGEVYLWGFLPPPYRLEDYRCVWSDGGPEQDERTWRAFIDQVRDYRRAFPENRLVHYANFERTQIALYARRYVMEEDETVAWLLSPDGPLFDLRDFVKQHFVLPVYGYGLKAICKDPRLVAFQWRLSESGSQWSVVRYHDFLRESDLTVKAAIKEEILTYNQDDVLATVALERWIEGLTTGNLSAPSG